MAAEANFRRALQLENDPGVHEQLGDIYRVEEDNDKSLKEYKAAAAVKDAGTLQIKIGQIFLTKGDFQAAATALKKAGTFKLENSDDIEALKSSLEYLKAQMSLQKSPKAKHL